MPIVERIDLPSRDPIETIAMVANQSGARALALDARGRRDSCRHLHARLRFHLAELLRALGCSETESAARINTLTIVRVLVESVLESRFRERDPDRERLAAWLAIERKKFVMAHQADALLALQERLFETHLQLRAVAAETVREIATEKLTAFWQRIYGEAARAARRGAERLMADLEASLGDLSAAIPADAMAGVDRMPIVELRRELPWTPSLTLFGQLVGRVRSKQSIIASAQDELVRALDVGSRRVIDRVLTDADHAHSGFEQRFCELVDAALESARVAAAFANDARAAGTEGISDARSRIATWSHEVTELLAHEDQSAR